jgi:hypothetical protein
MNVRPIRSLTEKNLNVETRHAASEAGGFGAERQNAMIQQGLAPVTRAEAAAAGALKKSAR